MLIKSAIAGTHSSITAHCSYLTARPNVVIVLLQLIVGNKTIGVLTTKPIEMSLSAPLTPAPLTPNWAIDNRQDVFCA